MSIPDEPTVRRILEDFELRIRMVLEGAWEDWLGVRRAEYSRRSRASMVFDFIKNRALAEFDGDPNIRVLPKGQTVQFLFLDRVLVRFKKANWAGLGSNIETQAVIEFIDPQLEIPGLLPEIYKVEVCYHLDRMESSVDLLAVTARQRNRKVWSYELRRAETAEVVPLPPRPIEDRPPEVRIRKPEQKPEDRGE